jgi:hypothetical protein
MHFPFFSRATCLILLNLITLMIVGDLRSFSFYKCHNFSLTSSLLGLCSTCSQTPSLINSACCTLCGCPCSVWPPDKTWADAGWERSFQKVRHTQLVSCFCGEVCNLTRKFVLGIERSSDMNHQYHDSLNPVASLRLLVI